MTLFVIFSLLAFKIGGAETIPNEINIIVDLADIDLERVISPPNRSRKLATATLQHMHGEMQTRDHLEKYGQDWHCQTPDRQTVEYSILT